MNNQFFGDIRDFYKYSILRTLALAGVRIGVCWLLTTDKDRHRETSFTYLQNEKSPKAGTNRKVFEFLRDSVCCGKTPDIRLLQKQYKGEYIIPKAKFFWDDFPDSDRGCYFKKMAEQLTDCDLVFLDPDIGFRTKAGSCRGNRYIRFCEMGQCWQQNPNASFMVFQYFHGCNLKRQHTDNLTALAQRFQESATICVIWSGQIAYYFLVRNNNKDMLDKIREAADDCNLTLEIPKPAA